MAQKGPDPEVGALIYGDEVSRVEGTKRGGLRPRVKRGKKFAGRGIEKDGWGFYVFEGKRAGGEKERFGFPEDTVRKKAVQPGLSRPGLTKKRKGRIEPSSRAKC